MVIHCPNCLKRYRLPAGKDSILRVRCRGCGFVFLATPSNKPSLEIKSEQPLRTAVIADIERLFRNFIIDVLRHQAFTIHVVEDGRKARDIVESLPIDLLLVNPYLPGMMGTELIAELRKGNHAPKAIFLLGAIHSTRRYRSRPQTLYGADDYLDEGESERAFLKKVDYHLKLALAPNLGGNNRHRDDLRLARSVFTDILVHNPEKMARVREIDDFFRVFPQETREAQRFLEDKKRGGAELLRNVVVQYLEEY